MTKKANKNKDSNNPVEVEPVEEQTTEEKPIDEPVEEKPVVEPTPVTLKVNKNEVTTSRAFIQKLKEEHKKDKILDSVYIAFKTVVPMTDTESNYRKIWIKNFKRK
ncbi:MAG: hypothetical protein KAS04_01110 [Candidatus Aenigmarchaeota archaeon]|nr:hypothetical protein [Candidatus Aenigmarchaeota archaeon]